MWGQLDRRGRMLTVASLVAVTAALTAPASATPTQGAETAGVETVALFGGRLINIAEDWGDATACMVWPDTLELPECFRTEADMDARIAELEADADVRLDLVSVSTQPIGQMATSGTNCSGYLKLYDGTSYTGASLYIRGRYQWFDLAPFNFNNKTSSFKIGPCSAYFADLASGGGAWYPTSQTQAYDVAATMVSGWNNDVTSLYIT